VHAYSLLTPSTADRPGRGDRTATTSERMERPSCTPCQGTGASLTPQADTQTAHEHNLAGRRALYLSSPCAVLRSADEKTQSNDSAPGDIIDHKIEISVFISNTEGTHSFVLGPAVISTECLVASVCSGSGRLLSPFTRRFRLGFALLRGGSRIDQHRAGVLSPVIYTGASADHIPSLEHPRHSPAADPGCVGRACEQPVSPRLLPRMRTGPRNPPLSNRMQGNCGGGRGTTSQYAQLNSHILDCGSTGELCELIEAHAEPCRVRLFWSRPPVVAVHTAVSPGFCTPTRRFQD